MRVISRCSPLAVIQVREAFSFFPEIRYRLETLESFGDKNRQIPLLDGAAEGMPDFFTRELDERLIGNEADVAVHSAKDLPYPLPSELEVYALLEAANQTDALVSKGRLPLEGLPPGARVGTSSATRRDELLQRRPDLEIVSIRGSIGERVAQVDNGYVDALVVATCALKRLGMDDRIAGILPFRTHPLQGHLALVGRKDRPEVKALFASCDLRRSRYGKVTLVGFGPGNPDLLTLGGDRALAQADVIFYDHLTNPSFLSRYPGEKVCVGKRKGAHRFPQDEINELVYRAAASGKYTVRLKGGDPMIFARGREELDFLQSRLIEVAVIPGISSGMALAACTHIPLTHRGRASSVAFVTGHAGAEAPVPDADTLVYYMGGSQVSAIAAKLIAAGRSEDLPVALAHHVSLPGQQVYYSSLKELQHSVFHYPTPLLMVVGEVVAFENGERYKQPVLVTGTSTREYARYTNLTHTPLIQIERIPRNRPLAVALDLIRSFDWLVFTSRYGVQAFFDACRKRGIDLRALAGLRVASVGKTTSSALRSYGIYPDLQPENESAEGLVHAFAATGLTAQRILLPRSDRGLRYLPEALAGQGHEVTDLPVYRNRVNARAERTDLSRFAKIIFTSPSGVDAFIRLYGALPSGVQLVARGKTTGDKLKSEWNETV
ncbi:MAG: uroporphyrinogen-III C-methyltransferase [Tannerella sp.]|nr:uroporphyrinogen-III C-methyltransferase [Tannerella sp.]